MLFSVEQDSLWRLVDCHTACMVVEQNFLLNLLDGRIACIQKYLTLLNGHIVNQDFRLNLLYGHIACFII